MSGLSCDAKSDAYILPGSSEADSVPYGFQNSHCHGAGDNFLNPEFLDRAFCALQVPVVATHLVPTKGPCCKAKFVEVNSVGRWVRPERRTHVRTFYLARESCCNGRPLHSCPASDPAPRVSRRAHSCWHYFRVIIDGVEVRDLLSFESLDIQFHTGLNVLVGQNGIGKSNLIRLVKLVRDFVAASPGASTASSYGFEQRYVRLGGPGMGHVGVRVSFTEEDERALLLLFVRAVATQAADPPVQAHPRNQDEWLALYQRTAAFVESCIDLTAASSLFDGWLVMDLDSTHNQRGGHWLTSLCTNGRPTTLASRGTASSQDQVSRPRTPRHGPHDVDEHTTEPGREDGP